MVRTVHVVGAGLAGLAAAVRLAGRGADVVVHEAAGQAGGRCRSYHDPALDMVIDNGNHLLLSANHAALAFLATIGAADSLVGPPTADFAFADLKSGERWTLRINAGRLPWWIFDAKRRVPGTSPGDYLAFARLLWGTGERTICQAVNCAGPLYDRLARPLFVAALNTEPHEASAALAGAIVRETLLLGGAACRPLIARDGLGPAFIEPALRHLEARGVRVQFGHRLRGIAIRGIGTRSTSISATTGSRSGRAMPLSSPSRRWWPRRSFRISRRPANSVPSSMLTSGSIRRQRLRRSSVSSMRRPNGCSPFRAGCR